MHIINKHRRIKSNCMSTVDTTHFTEHMCYLLPGSEHQQIHPRSYEELLLLHVYF